jgi:putative membrane protein
MSSAMTMWMVISSLLWLGLAALLVWALFRWLNDRSPRPLPRDGSALDEGISAQEILRRRFARGEIDAETFAAMRAELERTSGTREPEKARQPLTTTR